VTGRGLRKQRLERGLSTAAAAKAFKVSRRTWVRWESLPRVPDRAAMVVKLLWS
jgi:DNA-binding transcriptional regulator YiaG